MELVTSSAQGNCSSFLKQREAKQLETSQHFDKALICSRFDTIKKFLGILEKKWGHAKWAQKSNILATCGFMPFGKGLNYLEKVRENQKSSNRKGNLSRNDSR